VTKIEKLLVENYSIKFITSRNGRFLENIVLELFLEDGRVFRMGGISIDIAAEIRKYLAKSGGPSTRIGTDLINRNDPRFTIIDMLIDFPDIERVLHESIKEVVIDYFDPNYNIYGASIVLDDSYTIAKKRVMMIPSHAILLALIANRKVFVARELVDDQMFSDDDLDKMMEPYDDLDEWDEEEF